MDLLQSYTIFLLSLCLWREARNQPISTITAVAWTIRNRAQRPRWWGDSYINVILKPWQFTSFMPGDPNATKFPTQGPEWTAFENCWQTAQAVMNSIVPDPTGGATHYYDKSMDLDPPKWAATARHTVNIGDFRFYISS